MVDPKRYFGKGVTRAVGNINGELRQALSGRDADDQSALDQRMIDIDATPSKSRLGGGDSDQDRVIVPLRASSEMQPATTH
jgi:enolase